MVKLDKNQFEKFIEDNAPTDEPSISVFNNLQKEAVWNNPPSPVRLSFPVALAIIIVLAASVFIFHASFSDKGKSEIRPEIPVEKQAPPQKPEPVNVIAKVDNGFDSGAIKFMKNRSDDFNLSFSEDKNSSEVLCFARELDNI